MKVRINIEWEVPTWLKQGLRVGLPVALLLVGGVALAVPHVFAKDQLLSFQEMNENFSALETEVKNVPIVDGGAGGVISGGATLFCGLTPATPGDMSGVAGSASGYVRAKQGCEALYGATAHMCSGDEVARSAQVNAFGPLAGSTFYWYAGMAYSSVGSNQNDDCGGWGSKLPSPLVGTVLYKAPSGGVSPNNSGCNNSIPVLCCK